MASTVLTASVIGLEAHPVHVEVDISPGLSSFIIVGLPDAAVQEARERVKSAMKNAELDFPRTHITVNLAPADLKKTGTPFDLPIALAILCAQGSVPGNVGQACMIAGELGLDGTVRPIHGALSFALLARELGLREFILPASNAHEASFVEEVALRPATTLREVVDHVTGTKIIPTFIPSDDRRTVTIPTFPHDFSAIRGQEQARRALEIAAAGGHNVVMQGPPGSGKTLLARTFPSILPPLSREEALEVTRIHSVAGLLPASGIILDRPFRAPHHSASTPSIVGGGVVPHPGEISLAHRGVLFLDEFLEFPRAVLESMRQPLEDGFVTVSRTQGTLCFPARFTLLAALNPCPCGFLTDRERTCTCTPTQLVKYRRKLSGPLLDRIDLFIEVPKVKTSSLTDLADAEASATIRERVLAARERQYARFAGMRVTCNAELSSDAVRRQAQLTDKAALLAKQAAERFRLSARAYFRLVKVGRTIADLAQSDMIDVPHLAEAIQFRQTLTE
ncbi:MAG: YifB family Mg chelatase-like AAA ATPase [Patescibacteria group bacterium]